MHFSLHAVHVCVWMHLSCVRLLMDWERVAAHTSHQQWTKQSWAAALGGHELLNLGSRKHLCHWGGRPRGGERPWNGFGTLTAQYDVYTLNSSFSITLYLSIPPLLSLPNSPSVSFCPFFYPSSSCSLCLLVTIHQVTLLTDLYKPLTNPCTESCAAVDMCVCVCVCVKRLVIFQGKIIWHTKTHILNIRHFVQMHKLTCKHTFIINA